MPDGKDTAVLAHPGPTPPHGVEPVAKRGRHRRASNPAPKRTRPFSDRAFSAGAELDLAPDLLQGVRHALNAGHPLTLLDFVSSLITVVDPRSQSPFGNPGDQPPPPELGELVESFLDVENRETSALVAVIAELTDDELVRARIRRELHHRSHQLPRWLTRLSDVDVYRATEMVHILGDGDDLMLGARLADGHELTAVVYIDHNVGTIVKDAFIVAEPTADLLVWMHSKVDDPDTRWTELDLADARDRITECIDRAAITFPPFESDTWPACRPLVEWIVRQLPVGGRGYVRREWSDDELTEIAERFFGSSAGRGIDDADHRDLLDSILWYGSGYGNCDPLRWSPVRVEIFLDDWIPRKIVAPIAHLAKVPDLLRAFVAFAGNEVDLRTTLVNDTIEAVDRWEPGYQELIRSPRPQGPTAILAALGVLDPDTSPFEAAAPETYRDIMLESLRADVGSAAALDQLDDRPLPDEPFSWAAIPDDIHERVREVLELCDHCCDELLDLEYRTACRRLLAAVAAGDPAIFRRRARANTAAAAICWIVGKANVAFTGWKSRLMVKDLAEHFGLAQPAVSARAHTFLRALELDRRDYAYGSVSLGSPSYLVAERRRDIRRDRDRYLAMDEE
jgi:Domain of unknown function (DUF6398)